MYGLVQNEAWWHRPEEIRQEVAAIRLEKALHAGRGRGSGLTQDLRLREGNSAVRTQATTHKAEARGNTRSALFVVLALAAALAALVALAGTARQAEATFRSDLPGRQRQDRLLLGAHHGHGRG